MTQVTNKGNNLYYIEGFGNYQANKQLTLTELQNLVQKFENSGLINDQYDNEKTTRDLLSDTGLHDSFRKHYRLTKGQDFEGTNEDLIDEYKQYMRDYNYNLSQLSYLAVATQNYSENDKQALAHMWNVWEKYEKDDGMGGYIDIGQAFLKDPATYLNIASVGTGAIASVAARTAGKAAVKEVIKKYTTGGLIQGAINGAAYGALDDVARQNVEMQLGRLNEFDYERFFLTTGIGAGLGTAIGGVTGGVIGIRKKLDSQKVIKNLKTSKITAEQKEQIQKGFSEASRKKMQNLVQNQIEITLQRKNEGLSGEALRKARRDAADSFKKNLSDETEQALGPDGLIALGIKKKDITKSLDEVDKYFDKLNIEDITNVESVLKSLKTEKGLAAKGQYSEAHEIFVNTLYKQARKDVFLAQKYPDNKVPLRLLEEREDALWLLDTQLAASAGRSLRLRRSFHEGKLDDAFDSLTSQGEWVSKLNEFDNPTQAKEYLKQTEELIKKSQKDGKIAGGVKLGIEAAKELFIHNILGGTLTISANVMGSLTHVVDRTAMRYLGGVLGGSKIDRMKAVNEFTDLFHNLKVATQEAMRAINESKANIDNRWIRDDYNADEVIIGTKESPIYQKGKTPFANWYQDGTQKYGVAGGLINVLGNSMRLIGRRGIIGTDEFVKQLSFRSYARSLATDKILKEKNIDPNKLTGKKLKELNVEIEKEVKEAVDAQLFQASTGVDSGNDIARKAIEEARISVFQDDPYQYKGKQMGILGIKAPDISLGMSRVLQNLKRGEYTDTVGKVIYKSNFLDFVVPFVRTPANLISHVVERTPGLQNMSEKFGARIAAGGAEARQAHAALNTGILMWSTAMMWGLSNLTEGKGPAENRGQMLVRERTLGIPRHSILVGDKRINVRRLDPYARYIGIVGNMLDVYKYAGKKDMQDLFTGVALAAASSFADMPTLTGIKNLGDAFESESRIATYLGKQAGSLIPFYRLYNEILGDDRKYQQINSVVENVTRNAFGFFDDSIDFQRDPIFGKTRNYAADFPLPAFNYVDAENLDDPLLKELNRLQFGIEPPEYMDSQIDLRKVRGADYGGTNKRSMYDEYQDMVGKIKIEGETLEQRLRSEIDSRYYKNLLEPQKGRGQYSDTGKFAHLRGVIRKYREEAKVQLYKKYDKFFASEILPNKLRRRGKFATDPQKIESLLRGTQK